MNGLLDTVDVCAMLKNACRAAGGQRTFARLHAVSEQLVCDVLAGRREPGEMILRALGLVRVVRYARAARGPRVSADVRSVGVASGA